MSVRENVRLLLNDIDSSDYKYSNTEITGFIKLALGSEPMTRYHQKFTYEFCTDNTEVITPTPNSEQEALIVSATHYMIKRSETEQSVGTAIKYSDAGNSIDTTSSANVKTSYVDMLRKSLENAIADLQEYDSLLI